MAERVSRLLTGDLTARIRSYLPGLTGAQKAIAEQVLDDPALVTSYSINTLAEEAGTSAASVTRFCHAIGLSGYSQLRLSLAAELGGPAAATAHDFGIASDKGTSAKQAVEIVAASSVLAMQQTARHLDYQAVTRVGQAMASAGRIDLFGVAGSSVVCGELEIRLRRIGRPVWSCSDSHVAEMSACQLREGDVFVGVSRSGKTHEVIDVLDATAGRGVTTVAITSFERSPLAQRADIVLTTPVQDTDMRHGSLAVKYAQLLIADCIYTVVAQLTFEESTEALAITSRTLAPHRSGREGHPALRQARTTSPDGA